MTADFLFDIVEHKKREVKDAKKHISESALAKDIVLSRDRRPFFNVLKKPGPSGANIIAEIKRASPSRGVICSDLDPVALAKKYEHGGAAALSVLTDKKYFKGSIEDLQQARKATHLPVLRKDFLISSYQIYESAVAGADAVLLIVRILSQQQLQDYLKLCDELKLDALVEIHSAKDIEAAVLAKAKLIGINNRNLSSFETDTHNSIKLVSLLSPDQIPVAASGIVTRRDIEENMDAGINNFLVGESLVRAKDPSAFIRSLLWPEGCVHT
jgi:indole-3-glycerol phosphate synthase